MKERLLRKSQRTWRHIDEDLYGGLNWMVDFEPDSVLNMKLRKKDVTNYALNNEGNIYNNLINKVCKILADLLTVCTLFYNYRVDCQK